MGIGTWLTVTFPTHRLVLGAQMLFCLPDDPCQLLFSHANKLAAIVSPDLCSVGGCAPLKLNCSSL